MPFAWYLDELESCCREFRSFVHSFIQPVALTPGNPILAHRAVKRRGSSTTSREAKSLPSSAGDSSLKSNVDLSMGFWIDT